MTDNILDILAPGSRQKRRRAPAVDLLDAEVTSVDPVEVRIGSAEESVEIDCNALVTVGEKGLVAQQGTRIVWIGGGTSPGRIEATLADAYETAATAAEDATAALIGITEAIKDTVIEYAVSGSATVPPVADWAPTTPTVFPGDYVWMRTVITRADDSTATSAPTPVTGNPGPAGPAGSSVTIEGNVANASALPTGLGAGDAGKGWITDDDGHLHVWSGTAWTDVGEIRGPEGTPGDPGPAGVSVTAVSSYYRLVADGQPAPATPTTSPPAAPWTATEPTYSPGMVLYRVERVSYSSGSWSYTSVARSSAYAAAVYVANLAEAATQGLVKAQTTDPGHYPGRIWYQLNSSGQVTSIRRSNGTAWQSYAMMADQVLVPSSIGTVLIANGGVIATALTGKTVTGATLQTEAGVERGVKIDTDGLIAYSPTGAVVASLTGAGFFTSVVNVRSFGSDLGYVGPHTAAVGLPDRPGVVVRSNIGGDGMHLRVVGSDIRVEGIGLVDGWWDVAWGRSLRAVAEGRVTASSTAAAANGGVGGTVTITFPPGRFTGPPAYVDARLVAGTGDARRLTCHVTAVTATTMTVQLTNWTNTALSGPFGSLSLMWHARGEQ